MKIINFFVLPLVVSEAVCRCMRLRPGDPWGHLIYWGWNMALCFCCGYVFTSMIQTFVLRSVSPASVTYSILMAPVYSAVCFLVNLAVKNILGKLTHED